MPEIIQKPIQRLPPEELETFSTCFSKGMRLLIPNSLLTVGARIYWVMKVQGKPMPGPGSLISYGILSSMVTLYVSKEHCKNKVLQEFPGGTLDKILRKDPGDTFLLPDNETKISEYPMVPEGPMVPEEMTKLTEPEPFNSRDLDTYVPEFKSLDELDLNEEKGVKAPVRHQTYDELRKRHRESATHAHGQQHRDMASHTHSQPAEDSHTSTIETQQKKRVNQYGDIVWDD